MEIGGGGNLNVVDVLLNLLIGIIASYVFFIVRSIRREIRDSIQTLRDTLSKQHSECSKDFGEVEAKLGKLFDRTDEIPGHNARFQAGFERFNSLEKRIERIEDDCKRKK